MISPKPGEVPHFQVVQEEFLAGYHRDLDLGQDRGVIAHDESRPDAALDPLGRVGASQAQDRPEHGVDVLREVVLDVHPRVQGKRRVQGAGHGHGASLAQSEGLPVGLTRAWAFRPLAETTKSPRRPRFLGAEVFFSALADTTSRATFTPSFAALTDEHARFLSEVLNNALVKELCGGHGGFGILFEYVVYACLLSVAFHPARADLVIGDKVFPRAQFTRARVDPGRGPFPYDSLVAGSVYSTPHAPGVDLILVGRAPGSREGPRATLVLAQLTTADPPSPAKVDDLVATSDLVTGIPGPVALPYWFVTLFPQDSTPAPSARLEIKQAITPRREG